MESDKMETEETKDKPCNKKIDDEQKYDWTERIQPHVKIVVVGESRCGKSSLILAARNEIFPHPDESFVSKQYILEVEVDGKKKTCLVSEAEAGDANLEKRIKLYSGTNVVLLCFDAMKTLKDVEDKWIKELKEHLPEVPVILVRINKAKLKGDHLFAKLAERAYTDCLDCCPHASIGVERVFQEAVRKAKP